MKKNLVIGAITNCVWKDVEPFFNSFKQANFENTDCVMFVHNMTSRTLNKIRECGVKIFSIPDELKNIRVINSRWKLYSDFLTEHNSEYSQIFTADIRDVIFQRDIFKCYDSDKSFLCIGIEDGILTEECNKNWLINAYGENVYNEIKHNKIFCVGTLLGSIDNFCSFSKLITDEINSFDSKFLKKHIVEQAAGNIIVYHKKMFHDVLKTSTNYDGYIMTIGLTNPENIKLDANGNIFNEVGEIAAVVHQYDRKKLIVAMVKAKYCAEKNFYSNLIYRCEKKFNVLRRDGILKIIIRKCKKLFKRI